MALWRCAFIYFGSSWLLPAPRSPLQASLDAEDIRNEKVKVLKSMSRVRLEDVVLGQYRSRTTRGNTLPGYLDDDTVPPNR